MTLLVAIFVEMERTPLAAAGLRRSCDAKEYEGLESLTRLP